MTAEAAPFLLYGSILFYHFAKGRFSLMLLPVDIQYYSSADCNESVQQPIDKVRVRLSLYMAASGFKPHPLPTT
eukprot:scaffold2041_cov174-Ochromonas_danica.AAC.12